VALTKAKQLEAWKNIIQQLLIGKKIVAVRGYDKNFDDKRYKDKNKIIDAEFILFDDGETFLEFEDQDYYDNHDCNPNAKLITLRIDKDRWNDIMTNRCFRDTTYIDTINIINTKEKACQTL